MLFCNLCLFLWNIGVLLLLQVLKQMVIYSKTQSLFNELQEHITLMHKSTFTIKLSLSDRHLHPPLWSRGIRHRLITSSSTSRRYTPPRKNSAKFRASLGVKTRVWLCVPVTALRVGAAEAQGQRCRATQRATHPDCDCKLFL